MGQVIQLQPKPRAFAILRESGVTFYDYNTGATLEQNYQGLVRVYFAGLVDVLAETHFNKDGVRVWRRPGENQ